MKNIFFIKNVTGEKRLGIKKLNKTKYSYLKKAHIVNSKVSQEYNFKKLTGSKDTKNP